jgi:hypothetical protein
MLIDLAALIKAFPQPEGVELPPPLLLKFLSVLQPLVLTTLAVMVGIWIAPKVGLHAPAAEALAERRPFLAALLPQIAPGIVTGLLAGVAIVATWLVVKPFLTPEFIARAETFNSMLPAAVRFVYGGLTEEILLRWGVMTMFVWVLWKVFGWGEATPRATWFVISIFASALLFGIGHLPIASFLANGLTFPLIAYVVAGNSIFGIVAGFLYWRLGLESAMIAHIFAHVVLVFAISVGGS